MLLVCAYAAVAQDGVVVSGSISAEASEPGAVQPPAPVIGTGVVGGLVVNAKTKEPLRKASVTLSGPNLQMTAVTDASGSFTFRALPEGAYGLSATRDGIPSRMPAQIQLKDGEEKHGVTIAVPAAGSISGRVTDDDEKPVAGCRVEAFTGETNRVARGGRGVRAAAITEEDGRYRMDTVQAGRYSVRAWCRKTFPAPHGFLPRNDPMTPLEGYAQTTYGGALVVGPGAEIGGIDFHVKRVRLYILSGVLSGAEADLLQRAQISLVPQNETGLPQMQTPTRMDGRGHFTIHNVAAGTYELTAFVMQGESVLEGSRTVEAGKAAVTESNIQLVAASPLAGRVDCEDPSVALENIGVSLMPLTNTFRGLRLRAQVASDGTFEFKAVSSGHFRLMVQSTGYVKSLSVSGREVSPLDFELSATGSGPLHIQMGTKMATIQVTVTPPPVAGQTVAGILFNPDAPEAVEPRNLAVSDAQGQLTFSAAPGKYRVVVVNSTDPWTVVNQSGAIRALEGHSVAVEVAEGDEKQMNVGVVGDEDLQKATDEVE